MTETVYGAAAGGGKWDAVARALALSPDGAVFGVVEVRRDDPADPAILLRGLARQARVISSLRRALARGGGGTF